MADPFLGQITMGGWNFPPRGWATCDGQLLQINQNQALFSLLGTTYGGDGRTDFRLPDLRGRIPIHPGANGVTLGGVGGTESVVLSANQVPEHTHTLQASSDNAGSTSPAGNVLARSTSPLYANAGNAAPLASDAVSTIGNNQGHENMMPFRTINYVIALVGLFPSRS